MGKFLAYVRIRPHRMTGLGSHVCGIERIRWRACKTFCAVSCEFAVVTGEAGQRSFLYLLGGQVILTQPKATESPPGLATVTAGGPVKPSQSEGDSNILRWRRLNASNPAIWT